MTDVEACKTVSSTVLSKAAISKRKLETVYHNWFL
jgi:hypothetical protein